MQQAILVTTTQLVLLVTLIHRLELMLQLEDYLVAVETLHTIVQLDSFHTLCQPWQLATLQAVQYN